MLFSLAGLSEIKRQLNDFDADGQFYTLAIQQHPIADIINGEVGWETGDGMRFSGSDGFVFAFRVLKVRLRGQEVVQKEFVKGAMFGLEDGQEHEGVEGEVVLEEVEEGSLRDGWIRKLVVKGEEGKEVQVFVK